MDVKQRLKDGNLKFQQGIAGNLEEKAHFSSLINGQHPYALIITCSDSRVVPENIFNCREGELFVIRSAGNVINEGELASIEYGIEHLHIQYVLVLGHTHCGAIHAAMHHEKGMFLAPILSRIEKHIQKTELLTAEINALEQVKYIKDKFPNYSGTVEAGIYDIETNEVKFL